MPVRFQNANPAPPPPPLDPAEFAAASRLPTELIELIFSFADPEDKQLCASICLTNRLGHRLVTPLLYRSIEFAKPSLRLNGRINRLTLLCRTLLQRRDLATQVVDIHQYLDTSSILNAKSSHRLRYRTIHEVLAEGDLEVPLIVQDILIGEENEQLVFSEEKLLVLLAVICLQARSLHLKCDFVLNPSLTLARIMEIMGNTSSREPQKHGLHNILDVHLEPGLSRQNTSCEELLGMLWLRNLKRLRVSKLGGKVNEQRLRNGGVNNNLRELKIECCTVMDFGLHYIFRSCRQLKALHVEWASYKVMLAVHWWALGPLGRHMKQLEHLRLDYLKTDDSGLERVLDERAQSNMDEFQATQRVPRIQPLVDLEHLKTLTLPNFALVGKKLDSNKDFPPYGKPGPEIDALLPHSLKDLTVVCGPSDSEEDVRRFLEDPIALRLDKLIVIDSEQNQRGATRKDVCDSSDQ